MKPTAAARYALRALDHLAKLGGSALVTSRDRAPPGPGLSGPGPCGSGTRRLAGSCSRSRGTPAQYTA
jgi:hypothetical protein